ncbi:NAD-dependent epimerase/dehydratase family protein [Chelatococcus asaccharovorans]|uniref:Nucleoside-diphosphate-sugar epimerase n=1 Tax=Chelatococcus asaccharovorans TaxID=28210 RepID=A0A2V3UDV3_9HYPH|nr:NAD(P)-dependent oxidoreductase [Chelatococcus asaccharovorans]MBS7707311.1 NAD(P)-dependent oxidoreductase [Chelatococcus asaccharovorans]PXW63493.1 nucleoside-diphosphate-sugar epimerase [Chelatococcus asaccharovorans]
MTAKIRSVLVTGAAGLLGRAVVSTLNSAGHRVTALDRVDAPVPDGVRPVVDDLSDRERLEHLLTGIDGVIHCAAYAIPQAAREDIVFTGNVTATTNILLAAEASGISHFVYASSQSALGLAYAPEIIPPDRLPVDETHPCRPREGYALSKHVGEQICAMVAGRSSVAVTALRFPVIWAAERFAEHTAKRLGDPAQAAKSQWAYVDLRDAARACRLAIDHEGQRGFTLYNIAAPWPFAMAEAEAKLAIAYGTIPMRAGWHPGQAVFTPERARQDLGFLAEWRWTPEGIERIAPE